MFFVCFVTQNQEREAREKRRKRKKWGRRGGGVDESDSDMDDEIEANIKEIEETERAKRELADAAALEELEILEESDKLFKEGQKYFFKRIHNININTLDDMSSEWKNELRLTKKKIDAFYRNIESLPKKKRPLTKLRKYHINKQWSKTHHRAQAACVLEADVSCFFLLLFGLLL